MGVSMLDRALDLFSTGSVWFWTLWAGLGMLTFSLMLLMYTRWGQLHPLRKCLALSVFAHLLLAGYSTTVQIASLDFHPAEPTIHVTLNENLVEPPRNNANAAPGEHPDASGPKGTAPKLKPWESFADEVAPSPAAEELKRAGVEVNRPLLRAGAAVPTELTSDLPLGQAPLKETPTAQPESIDRDTWVTNPTGPAVAAQAVAAPEAKSRKVVRAELPSRPDARPSVPVSNVSSSATRTAPRETARPIIESPLNLDSPTIRDVAAKPGAGSGEMLAGLADTLPRRSVAEPADASVVVPPDEGYSAARNSGSTGSSTGTGRPVGSLDGLRTPLIGSTAGTGDEPGSPGGGGGNGNAGSPVMPTRRPADGEVPEPYKLRVAPDRSRIAKQQGASEETERAVQAAIKWLAENQESDGRWDSSLHGGGHEAYIAGRNRESAGAKADTAMTGLSLLTFLASGNTHLKGKNTEAVRLGLQYLMRAQRSDGALGGNAAVYEFMYSHAIATFAMSEAYGMTGDQRLEPFVRRAIRYTLASQDPRGGGWRYVPGDPGDTSLLGWQLMALKSAELAGIPIPQTARDGALRYLSSVASGPNLGLASYRPQERVSRTMTAEALVCRQFLGFTPNHPSSGEAGNYLLSELPGQGHSNLYYWYYGTLGMYQLQGENWERWNEALKTTLLSTQRKSGPLAGTWDPDDLWGNYGGRVFSTTLSALCLEVYYRYLPLYVNATGETKVDR